MIPTERETVIERAVSGKIRKSGEKLHDVLGKANPEVFGAMFPSLGPDFTLLELHLTDNDYEKLPEGVLKILRENGSFSGVAVQIFSGDKSRKFSYRFTFRPLGQRVDTEFANLFLSSVYPGKMCLQNADGESGKEWEGFAAPVIETADVLSGIVESRIARAALQR